MFRLDRNSFGGGLCIHANERIYVKKLNFSKDNIATFFSRNKPLFEKIADSRCK